MITDLARYKRKSDDQHIRRAQSIHAHAMSRLKEDRREFKRAKADHTALIEAQRHIQEVARRTQTFAHARICGLVSKCLRAVFQDEAYGFEIRFEKKRGKTEAKFVFTRDGEEFDEPTGECSGGMVEVADFALTLTEIVMTGKRRLLCMDEPFRGVNGKDNRGRLASLLGVLCRELDFQLVITTGKHWLAEAGRVTEIKKT